MDEKRTGEKWGWIGGWIGSILWMPILGIVILIQKGPQWHSYLTFFFSIAALAAIYYFAPWRHPHVRMWRLMLPLYILLICGVIAVILAYEGLKTKEIVPLLPVMLPMLLPFFIAGKRKWQDGQQTKKN